MSSVFNKNAKPFVPCGAAEMAAAPATHDVNGPKSTRKYLSYGIKISSLPRSIAQSNLEELIESIAQTSFNGGDTPYTVVKYETGPQNKTKQNLDKDDSEEDDDDDDEEDDDDEGSLAVLDIYNWDFCAMLIDNLNGYEWLGKILDVKLTRAANELPQSPFPYYSNATPPVPAYTAVPSYTNPHMVSSYSTSSPRVPSNGFPGAETSSPVGIPASPPPQPPPPLHPPGMYSDTNPELPIPQLNYAYGTHYDSLYQHVPPYLPFMYQKQQHFQQQPPLPHQQNQQAQLHHQQPIPHPMHPMYPMHPMQQHTANYFTNSPSSPLYLSRRSSSNRSFEKQDRESRKSSRASALDSHKNSFSSVSSLNTDYSKSANSNNSANGINLVAKQPVPPFIINMMNRSTSPIDPKKTIPDAEMQDQEQVEDDESHYMVVKGDDEEYKVNTRKLFVGNVPFTSNWMSLKKFLVTRSSEIDPTNELHILRVEIPMQTSEVMFQNMDSPYAMVSKSRGFAIVTTADKETSDRLIEMFDDVEFEGRSLTVRYDRFPEFSNYNLQTNVKQNDSFKPGYTPFHGSSMLNYLAFERNSYQQKLYYGAPQPPQQAMPPTSNGTGYLMYPYYYNTSTSSSNINMGNPQDSHSGLNRGYRFKNPNNYSINGGDKKVNTANLSSNAANTTKKITSVNVPLPKESVVKEDSAEVIKFKKNQQVLNDEEKARDLVITFKNLGLDNPA